MREQINFFSFSSETGEYEFRPEIRRSNFNWLGWCE